MVDKDYLKTLTDKYISQVGIGQFSYYRFADWLMEAHHECALQLLERAVSRTMSPKIVCLCGSTRFTREMLIKQWEFSKKGYIVLSWSALPDDYYQGEEKAHIGDQEGVKAIVDEGHKRKIDLCDEVFVINVGGYIGESTKSEIEHAHKQGKPVFYMENSHE